MEKIMAGTAIRKYYDVNEVIPTRWKVNRQKLLLKTDKHVNVLGNIMCRQQKKLFEKITPFDSTQTKTN